MDDLSKIYTKENIESLINTEAEETVHLEFKAAAALDKSKKHEIAKDVSAFANADGGVLIYGLTEKDHKAESIDYVDGDVFTKEWLQQIIDSNIQRKIEGVIIDPVRFGSIKETVYVVKIPRSLNAPHQTAGKRWYKRRGTIAVEMEEYEVRDLYNRADKTQLEILEPTTSPASATESVGRINWFTFDVAFSIQNVGRVIEKMYKLEVGIPPMILDCQYNPQFCSKHNRSEDGYNFYLFPQEAELYQGEKINYPKATFKLYPHSFSALQHPIKLKLYYSSDIKERSYIIPSFTHRPQVAGSTPHTLVLQCFQNPHQH